MPEVPLTYPTTAPTQGGAAPINVNAPVEAFGGGVGAALSHLGQSVEADSDRIWERAVQLQDLKNRAEVDEADTQYMQKAGELHAAFTANKGLNAGPEALEKLGKDLQDTRMKIRSGLSNPMTQRLYDTQTLGTYGRTMFNAAGHSGSEMKTAAISAKQDNADTNFGMGVTAPSNDAFEMHRRQGLTAVRGAHELAGVPPEERETQEYQINSDLYSKRAIYLAENPEAGGLPAARAFIDTHKNLMSGHGGKDLENAEKVYQAQHRAVGSLNIADSVYSEGNVDGEQTQTMAEGEAKVRARAEEQSRGDELFVKDAVRAFDMRWREGVSAQRYSENTAKQTVMEIINAGARTPAEIAAAPGGADALRNLKPTDRNNVAAWAYRAEETRDLFVKKKNFSRLWDLGHDPDTDAQAKFMDANLNTEQLDDADRNRLISLRAQVLKQGAKMDPRVPPAMTQLLNSQVGATLHSLGVDRYTTDRADDFYAFRGSLGLALEQWQQDHGKPPNRKELLENIAPLLLRTHTDPAYFGLSTREVPEWRSAPEAFRKGELDQAAKTGLPPPSDDVINAKYIRGLLNKYYPPTKKSQERVGGQ